MFAAHLKRVFNLARTLALLGFLTVSQQAHAAASVMIWPIDPVIEDQQRAVVLWVENLDSQPVTLQVRVMKWSTENYREVLREDQDGIAISPPMTKVAPGSRQLIRLIKRANVPAGKEMAYRVIIDELPQPPAQANPAAPAADGSGAGASGFGINVQMRYSIPLFVSGSGVWTKQDPARPRDPASATQPILRWRIENEANKQWLVVRNTGPVHAKLTQLRVLGGSDSGDGTQGLFGYVLPGASMRWLLTPSALGPGKVRVQATVNGKDGVTLEAD